MSARPLQHRARTLRWLNNPKRRPYRISITDGGIRIARYGELVLGAYATHAEAYVAIHRHAIAGLATRARRTAMRSAA